MQNYSYPHPAPSEPPIASSVTPASLADCLSLWSVQDGLLQQYRVIFVTMQSIFISVAAALLQGGIPLPKQSSAQSSQILLAVLEGNGPGIPFLLLLCLAVFTISRLWIPICKARGECVFLAQYLALRVEAGGAVSYPLRTLKDFQAGRRKDIEGDPIFIALHNGGVRSKMEHLLPNVFYAAWACLGALLLLKYVSIGILAKGAAAA